MSRIMVELASSSLGIVLVAVTEKGIRAVQIGDDAESLERELLERLPGSTIVGADDDARALAARAAVCVDNPEAGADLPLDVQGTEFQKAVWFALREVPAGSTISYTELARRIGKPAAVRAVAHACAENAHAVLIPCHRAVRSDGTLAGYRWGVERKRRLLELEANATACCIA
jgi:AraC family transcriptional regulator of adaptative response/methylated-DNA-[protein]-cysteine methyltransferase